MREVTREIQGLPVSAALDIARFHPEEGGGSDQQDVEERGGERGEQRQPAGRRLVVKEAVVGEGPTMKRMMPRARGSGSRILKRTSHIRIVLTDEIPIETRETRKAKRKAGEEGGQERRRRRRRESDIRERSRSRRKRQRKRRNNLWDKKLIQLDFVSV